VALSIGELVGFIRADDSGFTRGMDAARLRLRGLQRDTDGRLRDIRGRFISEGEAAGRGLADGIRAHAEMAAPAVRKVGVALAGLGVGVPAAAAAGAALGGIAAGAAAAGLAVKAFQLAAKPQLDAVADASAAAEKAEAAHEKATLKKAAAQKLAAKGGDEYKAALREAESATKAASEADAAYKRELDGLPPATRDYAVALQGLKKDHEDWSNSLSSTTMPVFTKGIQILRDLLPTLTPFVKAAASAFSGFLDDVGKGVKSAGFKEWAADMADAAGPALSNFLQVIKNLAVGFGGLLGAFLPVSDGMTGGLVKMTQAFADWGSSLGDSQGFATFMDLAREGGQTLGTLASAALQVISALSPLIGITAMIAVELAKLINQIPPDVLTGIATGFVAIGLAIKAYTLYTRIAAAVTRGWAIAQGILNAVMMMNPVGLVIAAIVALVAIVVVAYKKSETFRAVVQAVWAAVKVAILTAVDGILTAINWLSKIPGKVAGWFAQAKTWAIRKALELVSWMTGLPRRVNSAIAGLAGTLRNAASNAFTRFRQAAAEKAVAFVSLVRGLPGRARSALGNLGGLLLSAGRALIQGFINGIKSMLGSVKNAASSVVSAARNFFPFSPAKEGPFSGKGYTLHSGRALATDFGRGITDQLPYLRKVMDTLPAPAVPDLAAPGLGAVPGGYAAGGGARRLAVDLEVKPGSAGRVEALLTHIIRETVAVKGGGSVQKTYGRGNG
jgi:phage-related protein